MPTEKQRSHGVGDGVSPRDVSTPVDTTGPRRELLEASPFMRRLKTEVAQQDGVQESEIDPFFDKVVNALSGLDDQERSEVFGTLLNSELGPKWATGLIQAVSQLKTGAAVHLEDDLGARGGAGVSEKMERVGAVLSGLTAKQTEAFLRCVRDNPTGFDPFSIANAVRTPGEETGQEGQ